MIVKLIGAALVVTSGAGIGLCFANQWRDHLKTAEKLRQMIFLLKGEILYAQSPLEEAFGRVGRRCGGRLGKLFSDVSAKIAEQPGEPFYALWKEEVGKLKGEAALSEKDRQELAAFGEHLGYLDASMQERTVLLYLEQLDITIGYLREHLREKTRLFTCLGFMGGLFLTIVMY